MLQLSQLFIERPVLSLRTGGQVGFASKLIINPNNLKIEGWFAKDSFSKENLILPSAEIREVIPQGLVVNDHDALTKPDELVRLKEIIDIAFVLIDKPVLTTNKRRIGKISDFAVDSSSLYIQKLFVNQTMMRNMRAGELSIDRQQIVEITDKQIVVRDTEEPAAWPAAVPAS